jgi:hypothetical protein
MPRILVSVASLALMIAFAACESNQTRGEPDSWSSTPPRTDSPTPAAAQPESKAASPVASEPETAPAVEAPFVAQGPLVPPTLRGQLRELEAFVDGSELVLRAELVGEVAGEGLVTDDRVALVVELHGPSGVALVSHGGGPLSVRLVPQEHAAFSAGAAHARLEGRVAVAQLELCGEGLHQLVPEMAGEPVFGITLEPLEQFPYVWITLGREMTGGRNDARVLSAR